jgi:23S rRNA (uridine2552-2'-O)-methyltransferase
LALRKALAPVVETLLFGHGFCERGTAGGCGEGCGGFSGGRVWGRRRFLFRRCFLVCGTPDNEDVANALDGHGIELLADVCEQRLAFIALTPLDTHLDELVRLYRTLQFGEYTRGEAVASDGDDGIEGMGAGAQLLPCCGGEFDLGHFDFSVKSKILSNMKRSKTSKAWMREHLADPYVRRANAEGYRARAAYKLMEIDERDRLLRPGAVVVDLGAAPGSWCQVVAERCAGGRVFALDLLPMEPVAGVDFLQGDFSDEAVLAEFERRLEGQRADLVLSDIAPNISGVAAADQARSIMLCELALDFAVRCLRPDGRFLVKVFQGEGFMEFRRAMERHFQTVRVRKPKASRDRSAEVYLLGEGLRG